MQSNQYRAIAFEHHGRECSECGTTENLHVHHIDGDHENNNPENLIVLCKDHHWDRHRHELSNRASNPGKNTTDVIFDHLQAGRVTASFVAENSEYKNTTIGHRLRELTERGYVTKLHNGLYDLCEDPRVDGDRPAAFKISRCLDCQPESVEDAIEVMEKIFIGRIDAGDVLCDREVWEMNQATREYRKETD